MDQGSLVTEQIDSGAKLAASFAVRGYPLATAFWLKESEEGQWYLYLASDQISDGNISEAYRNVHNILGPGPHLWLDPWQIKVAGIDDRVVRTVIDLQERYPGSLASRIRNLMLGDLTAAEVYIYPLPIAASN